MADVQLPTDSHPLTNGRMPLLGFGTWQLKGKEAERATADALDIGYRHLDTATIYGNEAEVGRALSHVPREDVFVTTKCPPARAGHELETLHASLKSLGTEYVDLWLVHWPSDHGATLRMWDAFVEAREAGLARDIGVSNFDAGLIDEVTAASGVAPAVNQIEWSPLLFDAGTLKEHSARNVVLEGYSALKGGALENKTIGEIAQRVDRTPAQVIIRWHLQHGVVVIPKSSHADRVRSNADVAGFELSSDDMAAIDALGR